jgi:hypothetical protein
LVILHTTHALSPKSKRGILEAPPSGPLFIKTV